MHVDKNRHKEKKTIFFSSLALGFEATVRFSLVNFPEVHVRGWVAITIVTLLPDANRSLRVVEGASMAPQVQELNFICENYCLKTSISL